jgi:hypothetical protein
MARGAGRTQGKEGAGAATTGPRRAGAGAEAATDTGRGVRARGAEDAAAPARERCGGVRGRRGGREREGEGGCTH